MNYLEAGSSLNYLAASLLSSHSIPISFALTCLTGPASSHRKGGSAEKLLLCCCLLGAGSARAALFCAWLRQRALS